MFPTVSLLGIMFLTWAAAIWASFSEDATEHTDRTMVAGEEMKKAA
jgi:hypothetical protein